MLATERRNALLCIVGEALWGFQSALILPMTMLTLVLRHYGAGVRMLGAISAIEGGFLVLPQLIGLLWFRTHGARKTPIVMWHLLTAIPAIALYGIIILTLDGRASPLTIRWLLLLTFAGFIISVGIIVGAWMDWLAKLFHQGIRGSVMGITFFASAAASTVGGAIASRLLQTHPGIRTFGWIFLAAAAIAALAILQFAFIHEQPEDPAAPKPGVRDLIDRFRLSLANHNFRQYLIARLLATTGFCIGPFVAVHFQEPAAGGLSNSTVVLCGTAAGVAAALANIILGRLGDRRGHRLGVIAGALMQVLTLVVLLAGHGLPACLLAYFGIGLGGAVSIVSHNNMLFETCPHDHRLAHITVANLVSAIPLMVAPLLAGALAHRAGLPALFAASLAISVVAAAWTILRVRDPRDTALAAE